VVFESIGMKKIAYLDFDLLIEGSAEGYRARVLKSPVGEAAAEFALPSQDLSHAEWPDVAAVEAFGGSLFESLFVGEVRTCLRRSLDGADRQGARLGIAASVSDNDSPDTVVQECMISTAPGSEWNDPTTWGTLVLVEP
jgi:hypothetical protein